MNAKHEDRPYILCLRCGIASYHPMDIEKKYCGFCHVFHEDTLSEYVTYRIGVLHVEHDDHSRSKYNQLAEVLWLTLGAEAVVLTVVGGVRGTGSCVKTSTRGAAGELDYRALAERMERLAHALRSQANQLDIDARRMRQRAKSAGGPS